mmetsp:Transcript_40113/g.76670  ORF Transcript_40113/g.76670 Transcript_40113/m.76670 type:complete len:182 (+) Transcript_40113:29-574(+)
MTVPMVDLQASERYAAPIRDTNGAPFLDVDGDEQIHYQQASVCICFGNETIPQHPGTLYVTTRNVKWLSDSDVSKGYSFPFRAISMHAVSRDSESFPHPCIYMQIEGAVEGYTPTEEEDEEDDDTATELRVVPGDPDSLDQVFQAMCDCALLNPDPEDDDEAGDNQFFFQRGGSDGRSRGG